MYLSLLLEKKYLNLEVKVDAISSKEGRKETVNKLREEIQKAVKKDNLSREDAKLINEILKIQKELSKTIN